MRYADKMKYVKTIKKSLYILLCTGCVCMVLSGCAGKTHENKNDSENAAQYNSDSSDSSVFSGSADSDTYQDFTPPKVEVIYEDADITLPAGLVGDEVSDDHITNIDEDTASITYSLSGNERSDILRQRSEEITESISVILNDKERYPNITSITPNDDYTEFTIAVSNGNINDTGENTLFLEFFMYGNNYQIYDGTASEEAVTVVRYVDSATGAVIWEGDSTSMFN